MKRTGPNVLAIALLAGAVLCCFLSLLGVVLGAEPWRTLFAVTSEQNLPTWYSLVLMLLATAVALVVGLLKAPFDRALAIRWYILSAVMLLLSLDEAASIHERLDGVGAAIFSGGGLLHFAWVIPGLVIAAIILSAVYTIGRSLPRPIAVELMAGFAIFFFAALGLEMLGGLILDTVGDGWTYVIVATIEEFLEMLGTIVIVHASARMVSASRQSSGAVLLGYSMPERPAGPLPGMSTPTATTARPESCGVPAGVGSDELSSGLAAWQRSA